MHCYGDRKQSKGTGIEEFSLFFYIADTGPYGDCAKAVHEAGGKAASCRPCDGNAAQIFDQMCIRDREEELPASIALDLMNENLRQLQEK